MRLMIVGSLNGNLSTAAKTAMQKGAKVAHAKDVAMAVRELRSGRGADLLMVDVRLAIARLISALGQERIHVPVVACGVDNDAKAAVAAIQAGAMDYIPLPPEAELIGSLAERRDVQVDDVEPGRAGPRKRRPERRPGRAEHFARKYAQANGHAARPIAAEAIRMLLANPWRGNVRELENAVHRAVLLVAGAEISAEVLRMPDGAPLSFTAREIAIEAAETAAAATRGLVGRTCADVERDLILDTLGHCLGNRTHTANILGISIRTLRNKLKQYSDEGLPVHPVSPAPAMMRSYM